MLEGLAQAFIGCFVIIIVLAVLLIIAVTASFVGWPKVLACWPAGPMASSL